ncbi:Protein of unknown function [Gryllus bimaculatus]|nr:Protein of unknown function [Gryllus bimaculatus]
MEGHRGALALVLVTAVACGGVRASNSDPQHLLLLLDSSASMSSQNANSNITLLLITDGNDENLEQDLKDVKKKIESSKCRIIVILMGNSLANYHLFEELTGAFVNHVTDTSTVLGLLNTMQAELLTVTNVPIPINIFEEEFSENDLQTIFSIDRTVAPYTCIHLYYWPYSMTMSVNLTAPSGESQQLPIRQFKNGNLKFCNLPKIAGQWKIDISSPSFNKFIALQITANKNDTNIGADITFDCWIEIGKKYLSICGSVHPGKYLINNTIISVDITDQDGNVIKKELRHISGNYSNEGFYVRKHLNIQEHRYYNARCWARGQLLPDSSTILKLQAFTRVAWAGTFQPNTASELSFPSEIDDLVVSVEADAKQCTLTVDFTAPANAIKYKLILSTTLYDIVSSDGMNLSTVPGKAGTKEKIMLKIPPHFTAPRNPLYIAMTAIGEHGTEGEISNVAFVRCVRNNSEISELPTDVTEHTLRISTDVILHEAQDKISSTIFVPPINATITSPSPPKNPIDLETAHHLNTSLTTDGDENDTSLAAISGMDVSQEFSSNTSDSSNSTTTTTVDHNNHSTVNEPSDSLGAAEIVGIVLGVSLIIAIVAKLLYQNVYNRWRRRSYEVARRHSNAFEPFNGNDDL